MSGGHIAGGRTRRNRARAAGPWPRLVLTALALAGVTALQSCNIAAPIFYAVHGPPKTYAVFDLPDVPTVVFVDDRDNRIPRNSLALRRLIAETASTELMKHKVLETTIEPQAAIAVARQHDRYKDVMPVDAIAEAVGAEQIVYVEVLAFRPTPDGVTPKPTMAFGLKVVDAVTRARIFPPLDAVEPAHVVTYSTEALDPDEYRSQSQLARVHQFMAAEMADQIAKLFYTHETKELGRQLGSR